MKLKQSTFYERLRYAFEQTLSHGSMALISWLAVASAGFAMVAGSIISLFGITQTGGEELPWIEAWWQSITRMLDPGTFSEDSGWLFRIITFIVTITGVLILSSLIGIVSLAFRNKVDYLRRGRSTVLEKDHTLVIRWSPKIFTIISELIIANENQAGLSIVILGEKDKVEMEEEIRAKIPDTGSTRIICRNGQPLELTDIETVNPHDARSIIIISPDVPNPDTHVIKSVLALINNPNRKEGKYHIVAEIKDEANIEAAEVAGGDEVTYVLSFDVVAKVMAQTARQSGLSIVYTELLDYSGDEIYFQEEPAFIGKTFREALFAYEDSAVIGLQFFDKGVLINPPMDTIIRKSDRIIAVSEDDDTVVVNGKKAHPIDHSIIKHSKTREIPAEKTLFLGWNEKGGRIINELELYAAPGSQTVILADLENLDSEIDLLNKGLSNQTVRFAEGNITFRSALDEIDVPSFDQIIILSYNNIEIQEADARTLICLLHLRNIADKIGRHLNIVSEMLDVRNQSLADVARADDFIVSDKLISLMLTQLSENKFLKDVFDDFFDAEGAEIYLKPVSDYVQIGAETDFYTILESAAQLSEIAFGYRIQAEAHNEKAFFGIVINPKKSDKIIFKPEDKIIVLAED